MASTSSTAMATASASGDSAQDNQSFEDGSLSWPSDDDSEESCLCSDCVFDESEDGYVSEEDVQMHFVHVNPALVRGPRRGSLASEDRSTTTDSSSNEEISKSECSDSEPTEAYDSEPIEAHDTESQSSDSTSEHSSELIVYIPRSPKDHAEIRDIYDSGVKFFDKKTLEYLADIFDAWVAAPSPANTPNAIIKDLRGDEYEIPSEVGLDPHVPEHYGNIERYKGRPLVEYMTLTRMARIGNRAYSVMRSSFRVFQPMGIKYSLNYRKKDTKERIDPPEGNLVGWTFSRFRREYRRAVNKWEKKKLFETLKRALEERNLKGICRVVIIAGGTMTAHYDDEDHVRIFNQHGLVVLLGRLLAKRNPGVKIELFAQDPAYKGFDNDLLKDQGVKVVHDPRGFLEIDESTIVISIYFPATRSVIADIARPAAIICDTISERLYTEPRVQKMLDDEYDTVALPHDDKFAVGSVEAFIRKDLRPGFKKSTA